MATELTAKLDAILSWSFENGLDLSTPTDSGRSRNEFTLADGSGSNQVNQMWHDRRTLTPGSPTDDLDLSGALTNVFGATVTFTKIKLILIRNLGVPAGGAYTPTSGENLEVGNASNPFNSIFDSVANAREVIGSGGLWLNFNPINGHTVTAGSGDILRIALAGGGVNTVAYDIVILGVG